jgi:hypothetical protein
MYKTWRFNFKGYLQSVIGVVLSGCAETKSPWLKIGCALQSIESACWLNAIPERQQFGLSGHPTNLVQMSATETNPPFRVKYLNDRFTA